MRAVQFVVLMLLPTVLAAAVLHLGTALRVLRRLAGRRSAFVRVRPSGPPLEDLAADLRRLLARHDAVVRSSELAMRAHHLRAVESAITHCATQVARALGVPCPAVRRRAALPRDELGRLLQALRGEGLVLPPDVGLLAPER